MRIEEGFDKIQYPFLVKPPNKVGVERNFIDPITGIYRKPTYTIFNEQ